MTRKFTLLFVALTLLFSNAFSQCFTQGGVDDFEDGSSLGDFWEATEGFGSISKTTQDAFSGTHAIKATVNQTASWQVRISNLGPCGFNVVENEDYTLSFYAKGNTAGLEVEIFMFGSGFSISQTVFVSDSWELYTVNFKATKSASNAKFRLAFKTIGEYFVDDFGVNRHDCYGDLGGTAAIDACGTCAGGNTGVDFQAVCDYQTITPDNPYIYFEGVLEKETSPTKASFYRFKKDYATDEDGGQPRLYYRRSRSVASAGILMKIKTASPSTIVHLFNNNSLGSQLNSNKPKAIYKDNVLQSFENDDDITLINESGGSVEWKILFPVFNWYELLSIETRQGFNLEPIAPENKPVYVAIGNSITQGTGTSLQRSTPTYSRIVADHFGYELYNWGIGGSFIYGGVAHNFDNTDLDPEFISVLWGFNDIDARGDSYIYDHSYPQYDSLIGDLCNRFPDATIMAILPITANSANISETPISNLDSMRINQRYILEKHQATCPNLHYIHGTDYTSVDDIPDGVHPNDDGNQSLANGIIGELDLALPIFSERKAGWSVFPNPAHEELTITSSELKSVSIYTLRGRLVNSFKVTSEMETVSVSDFKEGTYILKTIHKNGDMNSQLLYINNSK